MGCRYVMIRRRSVRLESLASLPRSWTRYDRRRRGRTTGRRSTGVTAPTQSRRRPVPTRRCGRKTERSRLILRPSSIRSPCIRYTVLDGTRSSRRRRPRRWSRGMHPPIPCIRKNRGMDLDRLSLVSHPSLAHTAPIAIPVRSLVEDRRRIETRNDPSRRRPSSHHLSSRTLE